MAIKTVLLFQQTTLAGLFAPAPAPTPSIGYAQRQHQTGWTESMIWPGDNPTQVLQALTAGFNGKAPLALARAALLGSGCSIVGARLYGDGTGKGISYPLAYNGLTSREQDQAQGAVLVKSISTDGKAVRRFTLRSVPDDQIDFAEFAPTGPYALNMVQYFGALSNFGWLGNDPLRKKAKVDNVADDGTITTIENPQPFAVGQFVNISGVVNAFGQTINVKRLVLTTGVPNVQSFKVQNWTFGVCGPGKAIQSLPLVFFAMDGANTSAVRLTTRKTGRPFELYRGRRSKRKKTA